MTISLPPDPHGNLETDQRSKQFLENQLIVSQHCSSVSHPMVQCMKSPSILLLKDLGLPEPSFSGTQKKIEQCPAEPGVYLVWIKLAKPIETNRPTQAHLPKGWYCYAGSAHGPGGLRARLGRHLSHEKTRRWHVDQLTLKAQHLIAWGWHKGSECHLAQHLGSRSDFIYPLPGFGSSDCNRCQAHLLAWHP